MGQKIDKLAEQLKYQQTTSNLFNKVRMFLSLLWIDVKYWFIGKYLRLTYKNRLEKTKKFIFEDHCYTRDNWNSWYDIDVHDENGHYLFMWFHVYTKEMHDNDNKINRECDIEEEPYREEYESDDKDHWSFCVDSPTVDGTQLIKIARRWMKLKGFYDKDFEFRFAFMNQKTIDKEAQDYIDWVAKGSPPFKVKFAPGFIDSMEEIMEKDGLSKEDAENQTKKMIDNFEKRNEEIERTEKVDKIIKDLNIKDDKNQ